MLEKIQKRNGDIVPFDSVKIMNAISSANKTVEAEPMTPTDLVFLTEKVCQKLPENTIVTVEQVQDTVEEVMIQYGYTKTAKAYILYRAEHTKIRNTEADLMQIYKRLTYSYAKDEDIKRENANIDADTAMGTMLKYGSEGSKYFIDNYVLPKDIAAAHINGDIHIHDMDFYMLTETCCQIDLVKLFHGGFSTGHGHLNEPQSIRSYSALACIAIQANQNEMHGGQSVPNFEYAMAEGVAKTYAKEYYEAFGAFLKIRNSMNKEQAAHVIDLMKKSIEQRPSMAHPEKYRAELTGYTFADVSKEMLEAADTYACQTALEQTDKETYQAMEALIHNLNTMNSRAGAQVPFSSINYGTDTSPEGRMAVKNLLLCTQAGLGGGETPIFPVQIFKVKDGINYKRVRNYPFLMGQGIWLDSDELDLEDSVAEVLKHGTLSIGFIGLAETLKALTGKHHGESEASQKLGLEIIGHMRARMDEESKRRGLNFTLLATPAEGLSGRFVKIDQSIYGKIEGVTDREYYTNSFHVPVYYPIKAYKKIEIEAPYHALTNAGHISYVELDGDTCKNLEAFERIIKYMKEKGIGYGSINHPVDRDPVCGYTGVIDDVCPRCGRREGEGVSVEKLRELRKIYPNVPKC